MCHARLCAADVRRRVLKCQPVVSRESLDDLSDLAGRSAVHLRDRPERFRRFCPDCREDTAHEGFDELGVGWYAQISHCQRCGRQGMRVWSLA